MPVPGHNAPLTHLLILVICILLACLHHLFPHLSLFFTFALNLSFPLRIDPLCFQAGCRKK